MGVAFLRASLAVSDEDHLACDGCRDALAIDTESLRMARARHRLPDEHSDRLHDEVVKRIEERQLGGMTGRVSVATIGTSVTVVATARELLSADWVRCSPQCGVCGRVGRQPTE